MGPLGVVVSGRGPLLSVFPGLWSPSRLGADRRSVLGHRHGRAVALEDDGDLESIGLRFEFLRFRAGGRNGRGSRTMMIALPPSLTVILVVADSTCAR